LGNGSIDAEVEARLNLECFDVISNVFNHCPQCLQSLSNWCRCCS
jgi:hypothetical protein